MKTRVIYIAVACLLLGLSFGLFANGISGEFVYDDTIVLPRPDLHSIADLPQLFLSPYHYNSPQSGLYRPLTLMTFALNFIFFGDGSQSFHITNIILHAAVSFLLFILVFRLAHKYLPALLTALFFLVLPIHVEAVTSIVGRNDLLMALFGLLFLLYRSRVGWASIFLLLSFLSKETAIAFLPIAFGFFLLIDGKSWREAARSTAFYLLPFAFYFILRYQALGAYMLKNETDFVYNPLRDAPFPHDLWTALKVLAIYLEQTFVPFHLASDYSYNQIPIVTNPLRDPLALLGVAIILSRMLLISSWRRHRVAAIASLLFLMPYLVISNIFYKTGTIMAERLMYLPSAGVALLTALLFVWVIERGPRLRFLAIVIFCLILASYGGVVLARNKVWLTQEALSRDAYRKSPDSVIAQLGMAQVFLSRGQSIEARRILERANRSYDKNPEILNLLGVIAWSEKKYNEAEVYFLRVLSLRPNYFDTLTNISRMYYQQGKLVESAGHLRRMIDRFGYESGIQNVKLFFLVSNRIKNYSDILNFKDMPLAYSEDKDLSFLIGYAYIMVGDLERGYSLIGLRDERLIQARFDALLKNF